MSRRQRAAAQSAPARPDPMPAGAAQASANSQAMSAPVSPAIAAAIEPAAVQGASGPAAQGGAAHGRGRRGRAAGSARPTPSTLRRLSAVGLLAGALTGAASYGAVTANESAAHESAVAANIAMKTSGARVAIAQARAATATSVLTASPDSGPALTSAATALSQAADLLGDAGAQTSDETVATQLSQAQQALPAYAATAASAVTRSPGSAGAEGPGSQLRAGDAALTTAIEPLPGLVNGTLQSALDGQGTATAIALLPVLVGGGATIVLAGSMVWLARKTHRIVNPPLLLGTLLLAATTVASAGTAAQSAQIVTAAGQSAQATQTHGSILAAAHEARAAELAAVLPGTTAQATDAVAEASTASEAVAGLLASASPEVIQAWTTYTTTQKGVLDQVASNRTAAVNASTGQASTDFAAFLEKLGTVSAPAEVSPPNAFTPLAWLALLAGLGGGALAWSGFDRRLKDYR